MSQTQATPAPGSSWRVTGQQQTMRIGPTGDATHGVEVMFSTGHGVAGSVFVPDSVYADPQQVREAVAARAAQLDAVSTMTSDS